MPVEPAATARESKSAEICGTLPLLRRPSRSRRSSRRCSSSRPPRCGRAPADPPPQRRRARRSRACAPASLTIPRGQRAGTRDACSSRCACRRSRALRPALARRSGRARSSTSPARASQAYLARLARAQARRRRAAPPRAIPRRTRLARDYRDRSSTALAVELPRTATCRGCCALGVRAQGLPERPLHARPRTSSPSLIGADAFCGDDRRHAARASRSRVVDDGIDQTNPFFDPAGFSYPAGFPKGGSEVDDAEGDRRARRSRARLGTPGAASRSTARRRSTARTSPGSPPATRARPRRPAPDHPETHGPVRASRPARWIGNYRVFNVPTPAGEQSRYTPEIVAAFEAAVNDGMDVINFSGGGPRSTRPTTRSSRRVAERRRGGRRPGDLGRQRPRRLRPRLRRLAGHRAGRDLASPRSRTCTSSAPTLDGDRRRARPRACSTSRSVQPSGDASAVGRGDQTLVDVGTIVGTDGTAGRPRTSAAHRVRPERPALHLAAGRLADGAIALVSRGGCTFASKVERVRRPPARSGSCSSTTAPARRTSIPLQLALPGGMIADLDGADLRAYLGGARRARDRSARSRRTTRARSRPAAAGSSRASRPAARRPSATSSSRTSPHPGGKILSSTLSRKRPATPFAVFDGTSMAAPHVVGRRGAPAPAAPGLVAAAGQVGADVHGRARLGRHRAHEGGLGAARGRRPDRRRGRNDPKLFTEPSSLSFGYLNVDAGPARKPLLLVDHRRGRTASETWSVEVQPQSASAGATLDLDLLGHDLARRRPSTCRSWRRASHAAPTRRRLRLHRAAPRRRPGADPVRLLRHAPADSSRAPRDTIRAVPDRRHAQGHEPRQPYRFPTGRSGRRRPTSARRSTRTAPSSVYTDARQRARGERRASPWSRPSPTR